MTKLVSIIRAASLELLTHKKYKSASPIEVVCLAFEEYLEKDMKVRAARKDVKEEAIRQTFTVNRTGNA